MYIALFLRVRIKRQERRNGELIQLIGARSINSAKMPVAANDLVSFTRYFAKVENEL